MKNSKKNLKRVGQNAPEIKSSHKHDANLQKNSTLYFQIGLILCLLGAYALFEMKFQDKKITFTEPHYDEVAIIDVAPNYKVEKIKIENPKPKVERSQIITDKIKPVKDDTPVLEDKLFVVDPKPTPQPISIGSLEDEKDPEDEAVFVPFTRIEKVPIYPGCEKYKTNTKRKQCMSKKVNKLVNRKFNTGLGEMYGLSGIQKIQTQFVIDKNGKVSDIKVRAPHPQLEKEAKRVILQLPLMQPGFQRNTPVGVLYNLDIKFQVNY